MGLRKEEWYSTARVLTGTASSVEGTVADVATNSVGCACNGCGGRGDRQRTESRVCLFEATLRNRVGSPRKLTRMVRAKGRSWAADQGVLHLRQRSRWTPPKATPETPDSRGGGSGSTASRSVLFVFQRTGRPDQILQPEGARAPRPPKRRRESLSLSAPVSHFKNRRLCADGGRGQP